MKFVATARLDSGPDATALGRVCEVSDLFDSERIWIRFDGHDTQALRSEIVAIKSVTDPKTSLPDLTGEQLALLPSDPAFFVAIFGASDADAFLVDVDTEIATRAAKAEAERQAKDEAERLASIARAKAEEEKRRATSEAENARMQVLVQKIVSDALAQH